MPGTPQNINPLEQERQNYLNNVTDFHKSLEKFIFQTYEIEITWSKPIAWGYRTTSFYLEDKKRNTFLIKLTKKNQGKIESLKRDVDVANYVKDTINTTHYISSKTGNFVEEYKDYYTRLQHHIEGVAAFDITYDVLNQAIAQLNRLHAHSLPNFSLPKLETRENNMKLLHGDLTPSNILVSYDKVTAIIDFELALIGPVEYDIARLITMSWIRMEDSFKNVFEKVTREYEGCCNNVVQLDHVLTANFCTISMEERIKNIEKHGERYKDQKAWKKEIEYNKNKLKDIRAFKESIS